MNKIKFAFFGTSHYSVLALNELKRLGFVPAILISQSDKPQGRNLEILPTEVKTWALENKIPCLQPENLNDEKFILELREAKVDIFVVVAYGKIIPKTVLEIPAFGALNIHASLLPKFRGASPLESAILADDKNAGVTIIKIDEEMDHGPIVAQEKVKIENWPLTARALGDALVSAGAKLLAEILPDYLLGKIKLIPQNESDATYAKKIKKSDGLIDLTGNPYENFLKIQAFSGWPNAYFFIERNGKKIRVIVKKAEYENGALKILHVVPEGKKEMDYSERNNFLIA